MTVAYIIAFLAFWQVFPLNEHGMLWYDMASHHSDRQPCIDIPAMQTKWTASVAYVGGLNSHAAQGATMLSKSTPLTEEPLPISAYTLYF